MSERDDDVAHGRRTWITDALESRQRVQQAIIQADQQQVNPKRKINPARVITELHSALLDYSDFIRPKAQKHLTHPPRDDQDDPQGLWNETIEEIKVPKSGRYDGGMTDEWDQFNLTMSLLNELPTETWMVTPASLNDRWRSDNTQTYQFDVKTKQGHSVETITKQIYLPYHAATRLYSHLDRCMDELGWLPDVEEQPLQWNEQDPKLEG